jgi:hypothetical protein
MHATLELALCFHHAVLGADSDLSAAITRLRDLIRRGDHAFYLEVAHFMADLPLPEDLHTQTHWIDGEAETRNRWHNLVTARRDHLRR